MTELHRVRVALTGFIGGPGVSTFICANGVTFAPQLRTFYDAVKDMFPNEVVAQVEGGGDIFESTTGEVSGVWSVAEPAAVNGTSTAQHAGPAGILCQWYTDTYLSGRRLRGRTFLVPAAANQFDTNGQVDSSAVATVEAAQVALIAAAGTGFNIWQRPIKAGKPRGPRGGGNGGVVSGKCGKKVCVLRTRRD